MSGRFTVDGVLGIPGRFGMHSHKPSAPNEVPQATLESGDAVEAQLRPCPPVREGVGRSRSARPIMRCV